MIFQYFQLLQFYVLVFHFSMWDISSIIHSKSFSHQIQALLSSKSFPCFCLLIGILNWEEFLLERRRFGTTFRHPLRWKNPGFDPKHLSYKIFYKFWQKSWEKSLRKVLIITFFGSFFIEFTKKVSFLQFFATLFSFTLLFFRKVSPVSPISFHLNSHQFWHSPTQ